MENEKYLSEQIITYIGNKRSLLKEINNEVELIAKKKKLDINHPNLICVDLFSGSGIVSRSFKQYSRLVIANDLESYSKVLNECYLSNKEDFDEEMFYFYLNRINYMISENPIRGIISNNYAPLNENNITPNDRVFYTQENALYIDSYRYYVEELVPVEYRKYFFAPLLSEASIHVNTSGVFKGFYKDKNTGLGKFGGTAENALSRIKGRISINAPVLSDNSSDYIVYQEDAVSLSKKLQHSDIVYIDPPYNQHPYGSNYFMLNLILKNQMPESISRVSGIPNDWNHSVFNNKKEALNSMETIVSSLDTDYIIISYNNEGFISFDEMTSMLKKFGKLKTVDIIYNTFRGCRNLNNREIHTNEYLFVLNKKEF